MKNSLPKRIIAIVGPIGAGKTTLAQLISETYGYRRYRLTEPIYARANELGLDKTDRVVLQNIGDDLRAEFGPSVLADKFVQQCEPNARYVVESIRNHNELLAMRKAFGTGLFIIALDLPIDQRYQRVLKRENQYAENKQSFEDFVLRDKRDMGIGNADNEQNVFKCMQMADVKMVNDGGMGKLVSSAVVLLAS